MRNQDDQNQRQERLRVKRDITRKQIYGSVLASKNNIQQFKQKISDSELYFLQICLPYEKRQARNTQDLQNFVKSCKILSSQRRGEKRQYFQKITKDFLHLALIQALLLIAIASVIGILVLKKVANDQNWILGFILLALLSFYFIAYFCYFRQKSQKRQ